MRPFMQIHLPEAVRFSQTLPGRLERIEPDCGARPHAVAGGWPEYSAATQIHSPRTLQLFGVA